MVTNCLSYLPLMNGIIYLKQGRILEKGTYQELMQNDNGFASLVNSFVPSRQKDEGETALDEQENEDGDKHQEMTEVQKSTKKDGDQGKLTETEESKEGNVGFKIYLCYWKSMG